MFKFFKRLCFLLDVFELFVAREMKVVQEQQSQQIAGKLKEVEDAEAYRRHVIEEIIKNKVAIECIPDEAIAETTRLLEECPYDELKRLQWDYRFRTVMMDKPGTA